MFLVASLCCDNDSGRVVNVFIIWISIVSEFCPKLCEKGSSLLASLRLRLLIVLVVNSDVPLIS